MTGKTKAIQEQTEKICVYLPIWLLEKMTEHAGVGNIQTQIRRDLIGLYGPPPKK